jgi:predicted MFS family arabinose efflux permease
MRHSVATGPTSGKGLPVTRPLLLLFAIAGGAAVGNLYYAQPLLDLIGGDLHTGHGRVGLLVTVTQIGYALGILLIVPLGDRLDRRRLIPVMMLLSAVALAACAAAPNVAVLAVALAVVGVTTVAGQLLTPLTGDLAADADRGRSVGIVASGILTGILVSRTFSGIVAGWAGWRVVYLVAAVIIVVLAGLLHRVIPRLPARPQEPYRDLILSVVMLFVRNRSVQITGLLGALGFGMFSLLWTSLTFLLSGPPFSYSPTVIGLFGVAGLAGTLAAQGAGRLHDRGLSGAASGAAWLAALIGWAFAGFGRTSVVLIVVGIVVLDVALQGQNLLNQSRLFALAGAARSRVNTAYVVSNFIGGATGSAIAAVVYPAVGWTGVSLTGVAMSALAGAVWLLNRRGALHVAPTALAHS